MHNVVADGQLWFTWEEFIVAVLALIVFLLFGGVAQLLMHSEKKEIERAMPIPNNGSIVCPGDIQKLGGIIYDAVPLELKIRIAVRLKRQGGNHFRVYVIPMGMCNQYMLKKD
jgi:hypothetical protein